MNIQFDNIETGPVTFIEFDNPITTGSEFGWPPITGCYVTTAK